MYIIAFLLLIISISKLLLLGSLTWNSIQNLAHDCTYWEIKIIICMMLADALIGLGCSLFILI